MARRLMRARSRVGASRTHQFDWARASDIDTIAAASTKLLWGSFAPLLGIDVTIERMIVTLLLQSDQEIASEEQNIAIGMIVASNDAIAAGAASIPGPVSDNDADWALHKWCFNTITVLSAVSVGHVA